MVDRTVNVILRARDQLTQTLTNANNAIDRFGKETRQATGEASTSGDAFTRLGGAIRNLDRNLSGLRIGGEFTQAITKATGALAGLRLEANQALTQTGSLAQRQRRQSAVVAQLQSEYDDLNRGLQNGVQVLRRYGLSQRRINSETKEFRQRIQEKGAALKAAVAEERRLSTALRNSSQALSQANRNTRTQSEGLRQLKAQATEAAVAYERAGRSVRREFLQALRGQRNTLNELGRSFRESSTEAQRLGREIARTANPSAELVAEFNRVRAAAARTRVEFRSQQEILGRMRRILGASGNDLQLLAQNQSRFAAEINRSQASFSRFTSDLSMSASQTQRFVQSQQRASTASRTLANSVTRQGRATRRATREVSALSQAWEQFYGRGSRQSLSFLQRFRGQLLSLGASYVGLFGVIRGFENVIETFRTVEAAQARLSVVLDGDNQRVANTFDRLERTASRLGIRFGDLTQEYSAFAIATQATALEGEATNRIFRQVAEAARVNNLSLDQTRGVFTALQQIVSKGTLSMEELRQQLGDRIPGAVRIYADALDLSVEQLFKLVEAGAISSDTLVEFGNELERRFGRGNLDVALQTIGTAFGRLQNQIFLAFKQIGEAGAIDSLRDLFNELVETMRSADFSVFLNTIGEGIEVISNAVRSLVRNFDKLVIVIGALAATRFAPFISLIITSFLELGTYLTGATRRFRAFRTEMTRTQAAVAAANIPIGNFRNLLRSFLVGGLPTLAIGGIAALFLNAKTSADEATRSLEDFRDVLSEIAGILDRTSSPGEFFSEAGQFASRTELEARIAQGRRLQDAAISGIEDVRARPRGIINQEGFEDAEETIERYRAFLIQLLQNLRDGQIDMVEFNRQLDSVNDSMLEAISFRAPEYYDSIASSFNTLNLEAVATAKTVDELGRGQRQLQIIVDGMTGSLHDQDNAYGELETSVDGLTNSQRASIREARAASGVVNQLNRQRLVHLERLFQLYSSDAGFREISAEERRVDELTESIRTNLTNALRLLIEARDSLPVNQYTRPLIATLDAEIAETRTAIENIDRELFTTRARFFDSQVNHYVMMRDLQAELIRQNIDAGESFADNNNRINEFIRTGNEAFQEAHRALQELERIKEPTAEIQAEILRLQEFIANYPTDTAQIINDFARQEIDRLVETRDRIAEQLQAAEDAGDTTAALRLGAAYQQQLDLIESTTIALLQQAQAFGTADDALLSYLNTTLLSNRALLRNTRLDELRQEYQELSQLRQTLQQELTRAATAGDAAATNAARTELALVEGQLRTAAQALDDYINSLEEVSPALRALQIELRGLYGDLDDGSVEIEIANQRRLIQELQTLRDQLSNQPVTIGEIGGVRDNIEEVNRQLREAIDNALEFAMSLDQSLPSTQALINDLNRIRQESGGFGNEFRISLNELQNTLQGSIKTGIDAFVDGLNMGRSAIDSLADGFRQFAANFLRRIAEMITEQLAFNAAQSIIGSIGDGGLLGGLLSFHEGGTVGAGLGTRLPRNTDHLRNNEVLAVLERGETVLTQDQTRRLGQQGISSQGANVTVINAVDASSFLDEALKQRDGQEVLLNVMQSRRAAVRNALGI